MLMVLSEGQATEYSSFHEYIDIKTFPPFSLPYFVYSFSRYVVTNFTKNPEKYIRYTPEQVSAQIDHFFDISA